MIKKYSNILVIGATNRNLGKTEFISRLILRFSEEFITAVKIKTLYPGDKKFHGRDTEAETKFLVRKENSEGLEDSRRFLAAGAEAVYYIKSPIEMLGTALQYLVDEQNLKGLIIIV